jgi:hypothetical protein
MDADAVLAAMKCPAIKVSSMAAAQPAPRNSAVAGLLAIWRRW